MNCVRNELKCHPIKLGVAVHIQKNQQFWEIFLGHFASRLIDVHFESMLHRKACSEVNEIIADGELMEGSEGD